MRGRSEHRLQTPIGRDLESRGVKGRLEVRSGRGMKPHEVEISGAPIVYNTPYKVNDQFGTFSETMKPGVARHLQSSSDTRLLLNHSGLALARSTTGTLRLHDTPEALRFTATVDTRQRAANDLCIAIERGDVTQMSCGFVVAEDEWNDDWTTRSIHRFEELLDVSAVTYPARPTISIALAGAGIGR